MKSIRDHVLEIVADRVDARPYDPIRRTPERKALAGKDRVSEILNIILELRTLELELLKDAKSTMAIEL